MELKSAEILNRASKIILTYGIKSVTMDDLAKKLGISKKTLYVHFGDKRKMILTLVTNNIALDKAECELKRSVALNAIDEMFQVTSFVSERLKIANVSFFYDLRMGYPKAYKAIEDYESGYIYQTILKNLERGVNEKIYRNDMDPEVVAKVYMLNVNTVFGGDLFRFTKKSPYDLFLEIFHLHMRGIVNEKGLKLLIEHLSYVKDKQ